VTASAATLSAQQRQAVLSHTALAKTVFQERNRDMNNQPPDHQSMLKALDQLSQTVDVMGSVISRLQKHLESLTQQRAELVDDTLPTIIPPTDLHHLH